VVGLAVAALLMMTRFWRGPARGLPPTALA
jgi:hypothetical protein